MDAQAVRHLASRTLRPWEPLAATSSAGEARDRRRSYTFPRHHDPQDPWQGHGDIAPTFDDSNPMSLRAIRSAKLRSPAPDTALYDTGLTVQQRVGASFSSAGRNKVVEIDSAAERSDRGQPRTWNQNTQPRMSAVGKKPAKPMPASDFLDSIFGTDGHVEPPKPPAEDVERKMEALEMELARLLREIDDTEEEIRRSKARIEEADKRKSTAVSSANAGMEHVGAHLSETSALREAAAAKSQQINSVQQTLATQEETMRIKDQAISGLHKQIQDQKYSNDCAFQENKFAMDKVLATEEAIAFSLEELLQAKEQEEVQKLKSKISVRKSDTCDQERRREELMTKLQKEAMREQARYHDADTRAQVLVRSLDMHARSREGVDRVRAFDSRLESGLYADADGRLELVREALGKGGGEHSLITEALGWQKPEPVIHDDAHLHELLDKLDHLDQSTLDWLKERRLQDQGRDF